MEILLLFSIVFYFFLVYLVYLFFFYYRIFGSSGSFAYNLRIYLLLVFVLNWV